MIEIQAWMTIWATHLDEDVHTEINEKEVYSKIEKLVAELKYNRVEIVEKNGPRAINFTLFDNRKTGKSEELINLFEKIAVIATGSYGALYYWDDEDLDYYNEFRVLVARKGTCEWMKDNYFSPCIPCIEEN